jgi:uncharacterized protein with NRDE domain
VVANRDEFFLRPTAAATFWADRPDILAGRDLQAGGTWMGITRSGRFAALTNYRDPTSQREGITSRGRLVADFLAGQEDPATYIAHVANRGREYNGYNLLVGDGKNLVWQSNVSGMSRQLPPGIYGLSNHLLDTPWPKVEAAKSAMTQALANLPVDDSLFQLLRDDSIHPDEALPRTGVSLEWERLLSAAFVQSADYGTVSSTILLVGRDGSIIYDEQRWLPGARPGGRVRFRYSRISTGV